MTETHKEKFEKIVALVSDGMYQRFDRDPIVVQAQGYKIKIEHPSDRGTFITREYTLAELGQFTAEALANALLDGYGSEKKADDLLAYARAKFPNADVVRFLEGDFDREIVAVVELEFHGVRVLAGFSRELWDHSEDFEELREHIERHHWRETLNGATSRKALLGESGWLEWK